MNQIMPVTRTWRYYHNKCMHTIEEKCVHSNVEKNKTTEHSYKEHNKTRGCNTSKII